MPTRVVLILVLTAIAVFGAARMKAPPAAGGDIGDEARAATLTFAADVAPRDRDWVLAAIASARPEAQRLIQEIDGLTEVRTDLRGGQAIGLAELTADRAVVSFDTSMLNGDRAIDRNVVVLHELGHVVDHFLVDDETVAQLDRSIPVVGSCEGSTVPIGACTATPERFADTFAKWALHGRFSLAGSGYGIPAPRSIEDWGAPLGLLAGQLNTR
jgi:hypothetical protein